MLLRKVTYHNFRPFIGKQEILLLPKDSRPDANVTVILGDNTFGKSTFVLSFIWCLYGESRFARKEDILNKKVERNMRFGQQESASVAIEFEDDGKIYTINRTQTFTMGQNGKLSSNAPFARISYVVNGETKNISGGQATIHEIIGSILPKDLSSFFFFEGEKNNEISRKDLSLAVRTLLGLEAYDKMRTHLYGNSLNASPAQTSVMGYYLEKQNSESSELAKKYYQNMIDAEEAIDRLTTRIDEIRIEIAQYEKSIDAINEQLRQAAPSKELQKRRDAIAREIKETEEELQRNNKKLLALFSRDSIFLFVTPFLRDVSKRLSEMDVADKGIKGIEAPAIYELLERGVCLCGTDLKPGTMAYKSVEKYIDYIPPKAVGSLVRDMTESIEANDDRARHFAEEFEEIYLSIQKCRSKLNALDEEEREKLAEIARIGKVDTTDAENNLSTYKRRIYDLKTELDQKISERGRRESERETAENNFNMHKAKNQKAEEYSQYYAYAQALYNWVNKQYADKEQAMRERLNEYVRELFNNMYSGNRDIYIDEKYNINITYKGSVVDDTGGLRVIQYFAYVGGLVKLAYEVMQERDAEEEGHALGEQYPLVLDAAFSHADQTHTQNIARELAGAASQLIFAVMEKDWAYAKTGLVGKIGRTYELNKIDETEVQIVEVD